MIVVAVAGGIVAEDSMAEFVFVVAGSIAGEEIAEVWKEAFAEEILVARIVHIFEV